MLEPRAALHSSVRLNDSLCVHSLCLSSRLCTAVVPSAVVNGVARRAVPLERCEPRGSASLWDDFSESWEGGGLGGTVLGAEKVTERLLVAPAR